MARAKKRLWESEGSALYGYTAYGYAAGGIGVSNIAKFETTRGTIYAGPCDDVIDEVPPGTPIVALAKQSCREAGVICAPIDDFDVEPIYNVALAIAAALDALEKHGRVGICCTGGCGRTGTVASILLAYVEGLDPDEAMQRFSEKRGKECPETEEQRKVVRVVATLLKRHGPERTLKLLAMIEMPWKIRVDGEEVECGMAPTIGKLSELVWSVIERIWGKGRRRKTIDDVKGELGDLYPVARDLCTLASDA